MYWNSDKGEPSKELPLSGISNITGTAENNTITCKFLRNQVYNDSKVYNLTSSKKYFILVAEGKTVTKGLIQKHNKVLSLLNRIPITKIVNVIGKRVRASGMIKAHGILMVISWMILVPIGALTARYYRNYFTKEKKPGESWFFVCKLLLVFYDQISQKL